VHAFFEADPRWIAHAAINALTEDGEMSRQDAERAIRIWNLDPDKQNPLTA
jgi:pyruvate dehydrogenase complex dehydrogenase (E1) component